MSDLIERLHDVAAESRNADGETSALIDAADEIARQAERIEQLEAENKTYKHLRKVFAAHGYAESMTEPLIKIEQLEAENALMEDEWYPPAHIDAVQKRTIDPLRERVKQLEAEVKALRAVYVAVTKFQDEPESSDRFELLHNELAEAIQAAIGETNDQ